MDAPLGFAFLKKAEFFNLSQRLDKQVPKNNHLQNSPNTWPIEKRILIWSFAHHKHLSSPITSEDFRIENHKNKLSDWGLLKKDGSVKNEFLVVLLDNEKVRQNLFERGFARFQYGNPYQNNSIIISQEGRLMGEVLFDVEKGNKWKTLAYRIYSELIDYAGAWILLIVLVSSLIVWLVRILL